MHPVVENGDVYIEDVSLLQHRAVGNAMANNLCPIKYSRLSTQKSPSTGPNHSLLR